MPARPEQGLAKVQARVEPFRIQRDRLAQGVDRLARAPRLHQRVSQAAVRRGSAKLAFKAARRRGSAGEADSLLDARPVLADRRPVIPVPRQRVAEPHVRRGLAGILDRQPVLLGAALEVAVQYERRAEAGQQRHVPGAYVHRVPVALHRPPPVGAGHHRQHVAHADARRRAAGVRAGGPFVPLDGVLEPAVLHAQAPHSQERKGLASPRPGRLPVRPAVRLLRLGRPAEAREGVAPAQLDPRRAAFAPSPAGLPVAHGQGRLCRAARLVAHAARVHYGRLDEPRGRRVPRVVLQDLHHNRPHEPQRLRGVEPFHAERVDEVVPQVQRAAEGAA